MPDQGGNVFAALAQRRKHDRISVEPIVKVGAELPAGDHRLQVAVGGGQEPHIAFDGFVAAHPLEPLVLQHAQDLALHQRRHVAHLVEKQRALVALFELADVADRGPGEGPFLVAEQLAFQKRFRESRRS